MTIMVLRGTVNTWYAFPFIVAGGIVFSAASFRRFFVQWLDGIRGRNWPAVSATVDIVTVVEQVESTGRGTFISYLATLTYFYRNPDLQTGDYGRLFDRDDEESAHAWANSYKGSTVMVHVDPRDPAHSILRKEDI
ncbi:MAG TPA: hypothetical protein VGN16_21830 [Acidobacteriaceae bacterium]|jgi:hypothetical protein